MLKVAEAEENLKVEYWHYRQKQVIKAKKSHTLDEIISILEHMAKKEGYTLEQVIDLIGCIADKKDDD